ncbi:hypothetical protein [Spirosoma flavum]|uniref:DUF695 domain-containing protein n=1 Tax=Spirosoma flavum TaxID=2048557 RepID=A0ABW6AHW3_9BACT
MNNQTGEPGIYFYEWYKGSQRPPDNFSEADNQQMLLSVTKIGVVAGFYDFPKQTFYMYCQRYDSFIDKSIGGLTREEEINNRLEWVIAPSHHVNHWMFIKLPPE